MTVSVSLVRRKIGTDIFSRLEGEIDEIRQEISICNILMNCVREDVYLGRDSEGDFSDFSQKFLNQFIDWEEKIEMMLCRLRLSLIILNSQIREKQADG